MSKKSKLHPLDRDYTWHLVLVKRPSGKFKLYYQGQPAGHVSDWRGCNYKLWAIGDDHPSTHQPRYGFSSADEAISWFVRTFQPHQRIVKLNGGGTSFGDAFPHQWASVVIRPNGTFTVGVCLIPELKEKRA